MNIEDQNPCGIVVDHEDQYRVRPSAQENPPGWNSAGEEGSKREYLERIGVIWTDMRPLSLRRFLESVEDAAGRSQ